MRKIILFFVLITWGANSISQELNCKVTIVADNKLELSTVDQRSCCAIKANNGGYDE